MLRSGLEQRMRTQRLLDSLIQGKRLLAEPRPAKQQQRGNHPGYPKHDKKMYLSFPVA